MSHFYVESEKKRRTFYWLILTQMLSLMGSRATSVGLGIWLFVTTGQTTPLLLVSFFNELPGTLLGSVLGVWVDRWRRKWVLVLADGGQAAGTVILL
ncbi:MAG TPA: MFS transporter, partial [Anaerolineae bacterium]|nr:MFS transporter [Anaerolineae bacterium]